MLIKMASHQRVVSTYFGVAAVVFLSVATNSMVFAQATDAPKPSPSQLKVPPGGCMPIGLTASGEVVFPFQCRDFIEQYKAADKKSDTTEKWERKPNAANEGATSADGNPTAAEQKTVVSGSGNQRATETASRPASATEAVPTREKGLPREGNPIASNNADSDQLESAGAANTAQKAAPLSEPASMSGKAAVENDASSDGNDSPANVAKEAAVKQSTSGGSETGKPGVRSTKPVVSAKLDVRSPKQAKKHHAGPRGCTHFHSYDPQSGTYRDYHGRRRPCGAAS